MRNDLLRYSCQMKLPGFGAESQEKLSNAKVLVAGLGGLGCPAAQYLVSSGTGTVGLADFDVVSISNLHRQVLYGPGDAGFKKTEIAAKKLSQQNPSTRIHLHDQCINAKNVTGLVNDYDIVIDCTDNFDTRYLLNDASVLCGKPVVYGAIYQFEGQVAVWNMRMASGKYSPNYRDLFPEVNYMSIPDCTEGGVIPSLAGIIGCMQANEAIKIITGLGKILAGRLLVFDASGVESRILELGAESKTEIKALAPERKIQTIDPGSIRRGEPGNKFLLIDIRNPEEHRSFNIGGDNIPLAEVMTKFIPESGQKYIVYCATGRRSSEAVKTLQQKYPGIDFYSLEGGISNWMET